MNRITLITEMTKMNWGKLLGLSCMSGVERGWIKVEWMMCLLTRNA